MSLTSATVVDSVFTIDEDGRLPLAVFNDGLSPVKLKKGDLVAEVTVADVVETTPVDENSEVHLDVREVRSETPRIETVADEYSPELTAERRQSFRGIYESLVESSDGERIMALLEQYHFIFVLSEEDRGKTSLVSMSLDAGSAEPIFQPLRRTPLQVARK